MQASKSNVQPPRDSDKFRTSLRGACLVAALDYERAFGAEDRPAIEIADEMHSRLSKSEAA